MGSGYRGTLVQLDDAAILAQDRTRNLALSEGCAEEIYTDVLYSVIVR